MYSRHSRLDLLDLPTPRVRDGLHHLVSAELTPLEAVYSGLLVPVGDERAQHVARAALSTHGANEDESHLSLAVVNGMLLSPLVQSY